MIDVEQQLRAELKRVTDQVQPGQLRPLRAPERGRRRWLLPAGAVLAGGAIVAVAALLAGTAPGPHPAASASASGAATGAGLPPITLSPPSRLPLGPSRSWYVTPRTGARPVRSLCPMTRATGLPWLVRGWPPLRHRGGRGIQLPFLPPDALPGRTARAPAGGDVSRHLDASGGRAAGAVAGRERDGGLTDGLRRVSQCGVQ